MGETRAAHGPGRVERGRGTRSHSRGGIRTMGCLLVLMMAVSPSWSFSCSGWLGRSSSTPRCGRPILPLLGIVFLPFTTLMYVRRLHPGRRPDRCRLDLGGSRARRRYRTLRVRGDQERVHGGPPLPVMLAAPCLTVSPHPLRMRRVRWGRGNIVRRIRYLQRSSAIRPALPQEGTMTTVATAKRFIGRPVLPLLLA